MTLDLVSPSSPVPRRGSSRLEAGVTDVCHDDALLLRRPGGIG
jgi:hypothetical protein